MNDEMEEKHKIDLRRFTNHKKVFPWMFLIKTIIGLSLVFVAIYFSKEILKENKKEKTNSEIEVEISTD